MRASVRQALAVALLLAPGPLAALVVAPVTEGIVEAAPRSVAAFSFQVVNNSPNSGLFHWSATLPVGWDALGPMAGEVALGPGEVAAVLLLLAVPMGASPGPGEVRLSAWHDGSPDNAESATVAYRIGAAGRLRWFPNGALPDVYEGETSALRAYLENSGNVPVEVTFTGRSSLGGRIAVPAALTLGAGEGRWVEAAITAGRVGTAWETETVFLVATTADLPAPGDRAVHRSARRVLSRRPGGQTHLLRGRLELEGVRLSEEENALGLNLRLAGDLDSHRRLVLRVGEALPIGEPGAFARRETSLLVEDDRWGGYLVGRTSMRFTRLTAFQQWGEWASVWARTGAGRVRAFTSMGDPQEVRGRMAGVEWAAPGGPNWGLKALAYRAEAAPNIQSSRFAMGTLAGWARLGTTSLEAELAAGRIKGAGKGATGWRLAVTGMQNRWSWAGEARRAAAGFPGAIWNENLHWASVGYRVLPRLEVFGTRQRLLSPDLTLAPAADESSWEGGLRWQAWDRAWLSVGRRRTAIGVTVSEPVAAVERLWTGRLDLDLGIGFLATARIAWGERREAGVDENLLDAEYSLRYRPSNTLQVTARLAPAPRSNAVFAYRDRWSLESRWQFADRSWFEVAGQGLRCGPASGPACEDEPTYRVALGTGLRGRLADWSVTGYAQRSGGNNEVVAGIQLGRAVSLPSPMGLRMGRVEGWLRLADGTVGPAAVRIRLNGHETVTGPGG
ncbi:hypothetical protein IIA16_01075, partial [bacterium]|nr:hypothetical protein [bacterium]